MSEKEDSVFIRGIGSSAEPKGISGWIKDQNSGNAFNSNATINLANVTADLGIAIQKLMDGNAPMRNVGWLFAPRTWRALATARDGNGNLVWAEEMGRGTLMGFPFGVTTQIPTNLGGGSDESEIYLVDFPLCIIGETTELEVASSDTAAYHDGSNVVSAFSQDQTSVRAIARHDFGLRQRGKEAVIVEQVKWTSIS